MIKSEISVIIPVYQAGKVLENCLSSIKGQTFREYDVILIDDGSMDDSACISDSVCMQNAEMTVVHKKNAGPSSARNTGFNLMDGSYFVCVDSDDIVKPCYLADFMTLLNQSPEIYHVWCGFERTSENGREYICSEHEAVTIKDRSDYQELYEKVLVQSPCFHLFRTDIVRRYHISMRENLNLGEDILFNLEYLDAAPVTKIGIVNKANYVYLDTKESSLNNKYRPELCNICELLDKEIGYYLDKWQITDKSGYYNCVLNHYLAALENTFHPDNRARKIQKISMNSALMRRSGFREALKKSTCYMNPAIEAE